MIRFPINVSMGGKQISLTVEQIPSMLPSEVAFFKISKGRKSLGMIKMDGECDWVSLVPGKSLFTDEETRRICKEIFTYSRKEHPDLTVIYL